jgi:hypothetical protein
MTSIIVYDMMELSTRYMIGSSSSERLLVK